MLVTTKLPSPSMNEDCNGNVWPSVSRLGIRDGPFNTMNRLTQVENTMMNCFVDGTVIRSLNGACLRTFHAPEARRFYLLEIVTVRVSDRIVEVEGEHH